MTLVKKQSNRLLLDERYNKNLIDKHVNKGKTVWSVMNIDDIRIDVNKLNSFFINQADEIVQNCTITQDITLEYRNFQKAGLSFRVEIHETD